MASVALTVFLAGQSSAQRWIRYIAVVKATRNGLIYLILLVGAGRFERPTPCAQGRCATRLRYAPTFYLIDSKSLFQIPQYLAGETVTKS